MNQPAQPAATPNNDRLEAWKKKNDRLSAIELTRTLIALDAIPNQDRDRNKWKVEGVGNIIIQPRKQAWLNGNLQIGGRGSVSLVRHVLDTLRTSVDEIKDTQAMAWLMDKFPEELDGDWQSLIPPKEEFEETAFAPPEPVADPKDPALNEVKTYLIQQRGLPKALIEREVALGSVYATRPREFDPQERQWINKEAQCVFIGPSSAEIRSTLPDGFKGCCPGSDPEHSGYSVMFRAPHEPVVVLTEAAVDALSYHALHPHRFVLSTNGAGRFDLQYKLTLEAWRNGFATYWGLDADTAGDIAAQRLFNALVLRDRLAEQAGVSLEEIDEAFLAKKILAVPTPSPHELFLHAPEQPSYDVHEFQRQPKAKTLTLVPTDATAPATIVYKLTKPIGQLDKGVFTLTLTPQDIAVALAHYNVKRDRPQGAKDWNEVWKRQGPSAKAAYDAAFAPHVALPAAPPPPAQVVPSDNATPPAPHKSRFARAPVVREPTNPSSVKSAPKP